MSHEEVSGLEEPVKSVDARQASTLSPEEQALAAKREHFAEIVKDQLSLAEKFTDTLGITFKEQEALLKSALVEDRVRSNLMAYKMTSDENGGEHLKIDAADEYLGQVRARNSGTSRRYLKGGTSTFENVGEAIALLDHIQSIKLIPRSTFGGSRMYDEYKADGKLDEIRYYPPTLDMVFDGKRIRVSPSMTTGVYGLRAEGDVDGEKLSSEVAEALYNKYAGLAGLINRSTFEVEEPERKSTEQKLPEGL